MKWALLFASAVVAAFGVLVAFQSNFTSLVALLFLAHACTLSSISVLWIKLDKLQNSALYN